MTRILFTLLFVAFAINQFGRIAMSEGIVFNILDGVVFAIILIYSARMFGERNLRNSTSNKLFVPVVLFALVGGLSLIINYFLTPPIAIFSASMYLVRWLVYSFIFFVITILSKNEKGTVKNLMILSGSTIVVIGYIQYFFYSNLRNLYYLGWDDHLYRMFSTFLDPNFAGAFFVLFLLFIIGKLLVVLKKQNKIQVYLYSIVVAATGIAIFLTHSRSALVMLVIGIFVLLYKINQKKLFIGLIVILGIFIIASSQFFYLENINLFRTASSAARIESMQKALTIFKDNPIIGVGFNAYRDAQLRYGYVKQSEAPSHSASGTDNSYLFVLATTGILGSGVYLILLWRFVRMVKTKQTPDASVAVASFAAVAVGALFINLLFYPPILLWLMVVLGITENT